MGKEERLGNEKRENDRIISQFVVVDVVVEQVVRLGIYRRSSLLSRLFT
jgi:hypothetical protein